MSANDNKRYYWLKLKKDFFQQHQIKILKSLPNGRLYALIYLELLAESTSHDGELRYSEMMPYDTLTLASVIDEDKDNLEKAIDTFVRLELVEIFEDRTIYMREIERMLGSELGSAERQREHRKRLKGDNVTLMSPKCHQEIRDIENRDKSISRFTPPTLEEITSYIQEKNLNVNAKKFYDYYTTGNWVDSKGNKVKNWKQKILTWDKHDTKNVDIKPTYDTSNNVKVSKEELERMKQELFNEHI